MLMTMSCPLPQATSLGFSLFRRRHRSGAPDPIGVPSKDIANWEVQVAPRLQIPFLFWLQLQFEVMAPDSRFS